METKERKQREFAVALSKEVTEVERDALRTWAKGLLDIRATNLSSLAKARKALTLTASSKVVLPALKIVARQSKKHGWDNRSQAQRIGLGAAATGIALFGGANAGIAALGTAVGVPLWVVLGGGAMFAKYLYDELSGKTKDDRTGASYRVIDVDKEE